MWKLFNSKIRRLEKDNAELRKKLIELSRLINEHNENSLVNNDDSKTILMSDNQEPNKKTYEYVNKDLLDKSKVNDFNDYSKSTVRVTCPRSKIDENKKLLSTNVMDPILGEGTIYYVSEMGRFSVHFKNGEERDYPYNAFEIGCLTKKSC